MELDLHQRAYPARGEKSVSALPRRSPTPTESDSVADRPFNKSVAQIGSTRPKEEWTRRSQNYHDDELEL
jgi:hypothetical protein